MCGIVGVVTRDSIKPDTASIMNRLAALMERRGPDDQGSWTDDRHAWIGFRRLAILDLTPAGHQPMVSRCGNYVIVFNGEVYNFREIRQDLQALGVQFRSNSDTEVVFEALIHWGEAALKKFNGMFAIGFYDVRQQTLLLARDPFGIKPLYYLEHVNGVVFASQYDQIIQHPWCDRSAVNAEVLALYLRLGYVPAPYGFFRGTGQVRPGEVVRISRGRIVGNERFYQFEPARGLTATDQREVAEQTTEVIQRAVRRQLISDVPVAAFLSGGVDSPLVAGAIRKVSERDIPTVTIGTTDPNLDERAVAGAYAQHFGGEHYVETYDDAQVTQHLQEYVKAYSEPFGDSSAFPSMLLSKTTRARATVALSGDGGDELFWGYPRFAKVLSTRRLFQMPWFLRMAAYAGARAARKGWPPAGVKHRNIGDWYLASQSGLHTHELMQLCPDAANIPADFLSYSLKTAPSEAGLAEWMRQGELECHLPMILMKMDRASMHYSLEVRVPLLDLEVADFAARLGYHHCVNGTLGKVPLRDALKSYVPQDKIPERKAGFSIPMGRWLRQELRPYVEDLLLNRDPYPNGLFDRKMLQSLYHQHLTSGDRQRGLWHLLALQLWAGEHVTPLQTSGRVPS